MCVWREGGRGGCDPPPKKQPGYEVGSSPAQNYAVVENIRNSKRL
jgi:hypothetical protein